MALTCVRIGEIVLSLPAGRDPQVQGSTDARPWNGPRVNGGGRASIHFVKMQLRIFPVRGSSVSA